METALFKVFLLLKSFGALYATDHQNLYVHERENASLEFNFPQSVDSFEDYYLYKYDKRIAHVFHLGTHSYVFHTIDRLVYIGNLTNGLFAFTVVDTQSSDGGNYTAKSRHNEYNYMLTLYIFQPLRKPKISYGLAVVGRDLTLTCETVSKTLPSPGLSLSYLWRINNTEIESSSKYKLQSRVKDNEVKVYKIERNIKFDQFTCTGIERHGQNSTSDIVKIVPKFGPSNSSIMLSHVSTTVIENDPLPTVTCSSHCNPSCSFSWWKDSYNISTSQHLNLVRIQRSQAGLYWCKAENVVNGTVITGYAQLILKVQYQSCISSLYIEGGNTTTENSSVRMFCVVESLPLSNVNWKKIGFEKLLFEDLHVASSTFIITSTKLSDTGNYTCIDENGIGVGSSMSVALVITCQPRLMENQTQYVEVVYPVNQELKLMTNVYAYPQPNIYWNFQPKSSLKNTTLVEKKGHLSLVSEHYVYWHTSELRWNLTGDEGVGTYFAIFSNDLGETAIQFDVFKNENASGAVIGVVVSLMLTALIVIAVILFLKKTNIFRRLRNKKTERQENAAQEIYYENDIKAIEQESQDVHYENGLNYRKQEAKGNNKGKRDAYEELHPSSTPVLYEEIAPDKKDPSYGKRCEAQIYENTSLKS